MPDELVRPSQTAGRQNFLPVHDQRRLHRSAQPQPQRTHVRHFFVQTKRSALSELGNKVVLCRHDGRGLSADSVVAVFDHIGETQPVGRQDGAYFFLILGSHVHRRGDAQVRRLSGKLFKPRLQDLLAERSGAAIEQRRLDSFGTKDNVVNAKTAQRAEHMLYRHHAVGIKGENGSAPVAGMFRGLDRETLAAEKKHIPFAAAGRQQPHGNGRARVEPDAPKTNFPFQRVSTHEREPLPISSNASSYRERGAARP